MVDRTPLDIVKKALEDNGSRVKSHNRSEYLAQCPCHEDKRESLHISESKEDHLLMHCFAGCSNNDIVDRIGLRIGDLFAKNGQRDTLLEVYPYVDENEIHLFDVLRYEGKKFRQRSANGEWKLEGIRRVLYHLPKLLEGIKDGKTIFVVEGERDTHTLELKGKVATCNPGGAGKWKKEYGEYFVDVDVIIVADKDNVNDNGKSPGVEHARQVEASMTKARSVKIVQSKVGKDITDHINAGLKASDLIPIIDDLSPAIEAMQKERRELTKLIDKAQKNIDAIDKSIEILKCVK